MASEILCSHKFCDTKQMGRGERSLCYHIAYSTERKASEHTSAFFKTPSASRKENLCPIWRKTLEIDHASREKTLMHRQRTSYSGVCEVSSFRSLLFFITL